MRIIKFWFLISGLLVAAPVWAVTLPVISMSDGDSATVGIEFNLASLATPGPQNTPLRFDGFLGGMSPIPSAAFSLTGLTRTGTARQADLLMMQRFSGGTIEIRLPDNTLLLSGQLSNSVLHGTVGASDGMLFTTTFSQVTGGSLERRFDRDSLVVQMHLAGINGGAGIATVPVAPPSGVALQPFTALATVDILGDPIPEPAGWLLCLMSAAGAVVVGRRRGRYAGRGVVTV